MNDGGTTVADDGNGGVEAEGTKGGGLGDGADEQRKNVRQALGRLDDLVERVANQDQFRPLDAQTAPPLVEAIQILLKATAWDERKLRSELARHAGVSGPQLSHWLSGRRGIGPDAISKLSWALVAGMDGIVLPSDASQGITAGGPKVGSEARSRFDVVVNALMLLGGYSSGVRSQNLIWQSKFTAVAEKQQRGVPASSSGHRRLTVGRIEWPQEATLGGRLDDFIMEITKRVCVLIGHPDYRVETLKFGTASTSIRERRIDLLSPFLLAYPWRQTQYRFSNGLPGLLMGLDCVAPSGSQNLIESEPDITLDPQRTHIRTIQGEVADRVAQRVFPGVAPDPFPSMQDALQTVSEWSDPSGSEVIQVLFTNALLCAEAVMGNDALTTVGQQLLGHRRFVDFQLPLAFAVHPDEPALMGAVNSAIEIMWETEFLKDRMAELEDAISEGGADILNIDLSQAWRRTAHTHGNVK
jgi:hypothetical protein